MSAFANTLGLSLIHIYAAASVEDTYWAEVSYEQVLDWDPDYIILASDADYDVDSVLNDAALADCTAVREGHVYQLPHAIEAVDLSLIHIFAVIGHRGKLRQRHPARPVQLDLAVQRQKQRQHIGKAEPAIDAAAHRGAVAELHADNVAHSLPHSPRGVGIPVSYTHLDVYKRQAPHS